MNKFLNDFFLVYCIFYCIWILFVGVIENREDFIGLYKMIDGFGRYNVGIFED